MSTVEQAKVAEDVLDAVMGVEKRFFPLDLSVHYPKLRDLWYQSGRLYWDPRRDIPWDQFDASRYTPEELGVCPGNGARQNYGDWRHRANRRGSR
jgi:hypothetical protein